MLSTVHDTSKCSFNDSDNHDYFLSSADIGRREYEISNRLIYQKTKRQRISFVLQKLLYFLLVPPTRQLKMSGEPKLQSPALLVFYFCCANYHTLSGLKCHKFNYLTVLCVKRAMWVSLSKNQGGDRAVLLSGAYKGQSVFFPFSASRSCSHSLLTAPFSIFRASNDGLSPSHITSF